VTFFLIAVSILFLSAVPGALAHKGSVAWERCSQVLSITGCVFGICATLLMLAHPEKAALTFQWPLVPGALLAFKMDALSAVFLFPAFLVTAAGSLYGSGYWSVRDKAGSGAWLLFFYPILAGSMMLLLCSNNALLFLINWELMAISGYFLIITERESEEAHSAGFTYFVATHTGTLALFGSFALLMIMAPGALVLPAAASLAGNSWLAASVFLLALLGFGFKAGFIPLHIWLPAAHANAPSNVSALMSGVMIKMGIYGIIRITSFFDAPPVWWGQTVLTLGLISAILGVVLAIAQHDIKRLLAYHSVENIGIILLGLGIALIGRSYHNESMIILGLAGALLHVINHGLFKGLLFLSAGSIIHKTGTRTLLRYGGLWKKMPYTGFFFLGGAVAICGLPPLNGFVSEWMVYMGIFSSIHGQMIMTTFAAPGLAMTGGLALLCFAKVFGLSFLGEPRTPLPVTGDSPKSMLFSMGLLFTGCLWIGLAPATLVPFLQKSVEAWSGVPTTNPLQALVSAGHISVIAFSLLMLVVLLTAIMKLKTSRKPIPRHPTWGCGYMHDIPRVQYTTTSFAQLISDFFGWALQTDVTLKKPSGIFPVKESSCKTHTPDVLLDHIIEPIFLKFADVSVKIRSFIQNGIVGFYLLYFLLAICLILILIHF